MMYISGVDMNINPENRMHAQGGRMREWTFPIHPKISSAKADTRHGCTWLERNFSLVNHILQQLSHKYCAPHSYLHYEF